MLYLLMLAVFLVCSAPAHAANVWSGIKQVTSVKPIQTGGFSLTLSSEVDSACTTGGTDTIYIYPDQNSVTQEGAAAMLATALTALTTGMSVSVYYDNSVTQCYGRQLTISK